ncbi:hypothetical protein ACFOGJ_24790 [Marinibaculum pumilum]|uniref:Uncharacterized protein n=1 Tax=Marinibaculum pumilum TaxID=1766165 RepID=A0ABV7L7A5_9PROT
MLRVTLATIAAVVLGFALFLGGSVLLREEQAAIQTAASCPLTIRHPQEPGAASRQVQWRAFISDPEGEGPRIAFEAGTYEVSGQRLPACLLRVEKLPEAPFRQVDWRLGHSVALPAGTAGGTVEFSAQLAAVPKMTFGGASLYAFDNVTVVDSPVKTLDPEPVRHAVTLRTAASTNAVELWLRLTIHAPISPEGTVYLIAPTLTFRQ